MSFVINKRIVQNYEARLACLLTFDKVDIVKCQFAPFVRPSLLDGAIASEVVALACSWGFAPIPSFFIINCGEA